MEYRIERDTMGEVRVPADRYWGAQTQRSLTNFRIGTEKMPEELIFALATVKKAAAMANLRLGTLDAERAEAISAVCDEILAGELDGNFPLSVWQTGSGTQTNMNLNEVIANRANEKLGEKKVHPNDHVNRSQSSNDVFPTAMYLASQEAIVRRVIPAVRALEETFASLAARFSALVKTGRTHLQDATPLTLGQEISGWQTMLHRDAALLEESAQSLGVLAIGGTAVGTGLNAPAAFGDTVAAILSDLTELHCVSSENKFHALTSRSAMVYAHGALKALAADMMKIVNDVRLLASGPRCGIGELTIPSNEPGSSIMPGKVNPTQCEAVTMVAVQVMGNDAALGFAASQGNFELNVFMPVMIYEFLQSARLLAGAIDSFDKNCARGIEANEEKIREHLENTLMSATALNPKIGYENTAKIVKCAAQEKLTLREAAQKLGLLSTEEFDAAMHYEAMVHPSED